MALPGIQMTQINLHHSKSASAILARSMAVMHTSIALIQEPWILSSEDLTVIKVRVKLAKEKDMEVLIGSVYMPYDSMDNSPPKEVKALVAYAEARRLELLLDCDADSHHVGWGIIDITVCTERVAGLLNDWRVSDEPSGSDHRQIRLTLQQLPQISWNAIANAYELNCPPQPKSPVTKIHWWNKELEKLRLETRRKFSKAKRTRLVALWEAFRSSQQKYSKEIKKAKYKSWKHFCESIENAPEASSLPRILSLDHRPQLGCLKFPTGNVTEEASDTLKHLMEVHFPGSDNNIQPRRPKPRALERLIDGFLKNGPLLTYPLASSQYAYKEGRSTDTALHHLVTGIERQLEAKGYALGVFLDIEGAFDSTSYDVIGEAMTRHDIPAALADGHKAC
ncbi:uncharacterized protein LOC109862217 [Pseudomyrmex gracilis]|uniref:uncharacterized protein LOC109862217 n=1 Tax=Pseudomyrmex gracilis TaxID=219809 RepID=UPI000995052F|nr:uncharacterized protein LOC109862217 [Pseudomyrmex gracilis]